MDAQTNGLVYEFDGFRVDVMRRCLYGRDGLPRRLSSRAFDLLLLMMQHPGELLDKAMLLEAIWPDTVVEENNLSQCIFALRRALGESAKDRRYIATVPGRGYQFVAPVRQIEQQPPEQRTVRSKIDAVALLAVVGSIAAALAVAFVVL